MSAFLLAALLLAGPARADEPMPSAPVWLPHESFADWPRLDALLRERSRLKLTVALTPALATPAAKAALAPHLESGRVELAARIPGDPVLTLVAAHPDAPRPQDALERVVEARAALKAALATAPAGFVPGAGAVDYPLLPGLRSSGLDWVLAGPYAREGGAWASSGKVAFVPAQAGVPPETPGATVFVDSAPASSFLESALEGPRPEGGWATVSELLRWHGAPGDAETAAWTPWDPDAASVPEEPNARGAYDAYGAAARAVDLYMNSGAAELSTLDEAVELLREAQAARYFRPAPDAGELDPEFRAKLIAVYRRLRVPAPASLFEGESAQGAAGKPRGVRASGSGSALSFENPADSPVVAPAPGVDAEPWRLRALKAEWDEHAVTFTLRVGRAAPGSSPRPVYEVYVDLNGVPGAGAMRPLAARGVFFPTRDSWEYALVLAGRDARLYRHNPRGEPEEVGSYAAAPDEAAGTWSVSVPRSALRGNPRRWGYTALAYAEDPASAGETPPAPLRAPDGGTLLGLLAPLDAQRAALEKRRPNVRVPASRRP